MKVFLLISFIFSTQLAFANRPNKAISFNSSLCACKDGAAIKPSSCAKFCSVKLTDGAEILFANLYISSEISRGPLKNVFGWCAKDMANDAANSHCALEAKSNNEATKLIDVIVSGNSIKANLYNLKFDEVYTLTLVELLSGARSNPVKFVKFSEVIED